MLKILWRQIIGRAIGIPNNKFHPLVWISGKPDIGRSVYIGGFSEVNAAHSKIIIGDFSDIASFVSINCADSHKMTLGLSNSVGRRPILIGSHVFIGSHAVIKGGSKIGSYSVIAAATVVDGSQDIPPYSLVYGNPMNVKPGYYLKKMNQVKDKP